MRLICTSCSAVVDLAGLEPGGEMLCPCCDMIAIFESAEGLQEALLRVSDAKLDGRVLEDPAFPLSAVFDVVGAEFSLGTRPAQWQSAADLAAELNAASLSANSADDALGDGVEPEAVAAESTTGRTADAGPSEAGGLFGEAVPQRRRELDPALVNGLLLKARNLHERCQFHEASQLLCAMSEGRKSTEVTSISVQSLYLANLQTAAREAFTRAQSGEIEPSASPELGRYFDALKSYGLSDPDLEDRIWRLQHSQIRVRSSIGTSKLVAVILLLGLLAGALSLLNAVVHSAAELPQEPEELPLPEGSHEQAAQSGATAGMFYESLSAAEAGEYQLAAKLLKKTDGMDPDALAEELDRTSRNRVQQLLAGGSPEGRDEAIRHLAGMQELMLAADPRGISLKVRRVRAESLQLMADLMSQIGNHAGAVDVLTKAARLNPDLPGQEKLAALIADRMVSQLEAGSGELSAEIVIPELAGGAGFGLAAVMQESLQGRAGNVLMRRALAAARSGKAGDLKLAVEGFQSLGRRGLLDGSLSQGKDQFAAELMDQFESSMASGNTEAAWLKLAAAVELGADPGRLANAQNRITAALAHDVLLAVRKRDSASAAVGCERLKSLLGKLPYLLEHGLAHMSRDELQYLPSDVRDAVLQPKNSIGMTLALLTPGRLQMGATDTPESSRLKNWSALPLHQVELDRACYLGTTEVTVKQYHEVLQSKAKAGGEYPENYPCHAVSWYGAVDFCRRLSALPGEQVAGRRYRLPTEAEWEYACRAGTSEDYCFGNDVLLLSEFAWVSYNSGLETIESVLTFYSDYDEMQRQTARSRTRPHPVALRKPNAWGLFDMHGNAAEWTADWFAAYGSVVQRNPAGPAEGVEKVVRGGNWNSDALAARSGHRQALHPEFGRAGFRVVMERYAVTGEP